MQPRTEIGGISAAYVVKHIRHSAFAITACIPTMQCFCPQPVTLKAGTRPLKLSQSQSLFPYQHGLSQMCSFLSLFAVLPMESYAHGYAHSVSLFPLCTYLTFSTQDYVPAEGGSFIPLPPLAQPLPTVTSCRLICSQIFRFSSQPCCISSKFYDSYAEVFKLRRRPPPAISTCIVRTNIGFSICCDNLLFFRLS